MTRIISACITIWQAIERVPLMAVGGDLGSKLLYGRRGPEFQHLP